MDSHPSTRSITSWLTGWAWKLLPIVSLLSGAWAFGAPLDTLAPTALALALVLGGWMPLWRAITTTDWKTPLQQWRTWKKREPLPTLPYLQPGTPGAALHRALEEARAWWRSVGAEALIAPLRIASLALMLNALLSLALGRTALLFSISLLTFAELATLWHEGKGYVGTGWEAIGRVGLPWLLGASLVGPITLTSWLVALVVTILVGLQATNRAWSIIGPLIASAFLLWQGYSFAVGGVLLLSFPGWLLLLDGIEPTRYRRAVAPWLLLMLLLIAGALR